MGTVSDIKPYTKIAIDSSTINGAQSTKQYITMSEPNPKVSIPFVNLRQEVADFKNKINPSFATSEQLFEILEEKNNRRESVHIALKVLARKHTGPISEDVNQVLWDFKENQARIEYHELELCETIGFLLAKIELLRSIKTSEKYLEEVYEYVARQRIE